MDSVYSLDHKISYSQVDFHQKIQLGALFLLMQEAAIHHANQVGMGTLIRGDKEESWILNRIAMQLTRYPVYNTSQTSQVSLRYTDIDSNHHVNNAAYMDILQTALHHQNLDT